MSRTAPNVVIGHVRVTKEKRMKLYTVTLTEQQWGYIVGAIDFIPETQINPQTSAPIQKLLLARKLIEQQIRSQGADI